MKYPILIGSRALDYWGINPGSIPESDWDIIWHEPVEGYEVHLTSDLNNAKVAEVYGTGTLTQGPNDVKILVLKPAGLMDIIYSHLHRDLKFDLQMMRYLSLKSTWAQAGNFVVHNDTFVEERIRLTKEKYGDKTPSLMKTVDDFFDDAVSKKYDHDLIHDYVAFEPEPMYRKLQAEDGTVFCHAELWNKLTYTQKLQCVAEEAFVIAIERYIIPLDMPYKSAYRNALRRICTTLTGGWFRRFAIDNYAEIMNLFDDNRIFFALCSLGEQVNINKVIQSNQRRLLEDQQVRCGKTVFTRVDSGFDNKTMKHFVVMSESILTRSGFMEVAFWRNDYYHSPFMDDLGNWYQVVPKQTTSVIWE